jgi:hypothetical protein
MRQGQHPAGHTIHLSDNGRQASERHPCSHKESAAASLLPDLAERESVERQRRRPFVSEIFSSAPAVEMNLSRRPEGGLAAALAVLRPSV